VKLVIGFIGGVLVGIVAALLLAPESGQRLRGRLSTEASANWKAAQSQLKKGVGSIQDQLADPQSQAQILAEGD